MSMVLFGLSFWRRREPDPRWARDSSEEWPGNLRDGTRVRLLGPDVWGRTWAAWEAGTICESVGPGLYMVMVSSGPRAGELTTMRGGRLFALPEPAA